MIFEHGQKERFTLGLSANFACTAVFFELRRLFEDPPPGVDLAETISVSRAELASFAEALYIQAGLPPNRLKAL